MRSSRSSAGVVGNSTPQPQSAWQRPPRAPSPPASVSASTQPHQTSRSRLRLATQPQTRCSGRLRTVDQYRTIGLNLAHDRAWLAQATDSAIAAAVQAEVAGLRAERVGDSLLIELDSAATDLLAAADTIGRLRASLARAYGNRIGAGANLAFAGTSFTSVVGPSVKTRKKIWFAELEAEAIGGYGVGGDAATGQTKAGLGGAGRLTVTF